MKLEAQESNHIMPRNTSIHAAVYVFIAETISLFQIAQSV
jgi:hypothetical protein